MKQEVYDIKGMHCAACSSAIERVTKKLNGVTESNVNLPMNQLTIQYDETQTTMQDIVKKIERAGFEAFLHLEQQEEQENVADIEKENQKLLHTKKVSLIASVSFAGVLLIVSMGQMLFPKFPIPDIISMNTHPVNFALLQLLLCIPVLFLGKHFFVNGFKALFHKNPNMDTLVAISASASFLYSLIMTFLISDNMHHVHQLYYESAAVVVALVEVGKYLESYNKEKTKSAIQGLMQLTPDTAILVDQNGQWEVPTKKVKVGDVLLIKEGAKVPLDGVVQEGTGHVNETMLTGESMPVYKEIKSEVIGGSILTQGVLYVKVTHVGQDTTLSKIIKFVQEAQGKKAPIARSADKVAGVFVPIVMAISFLAFLVWTIVGAEFSFALKIFTSILVIACPCAMGLATPTAIIVGTGIGAQSCILIRSGEALENTHKVSTVVFDKTGTITNGTPVVTDVFSENEEEMLSVAYALESLSNHPLSKAVALYAENKRIQNQKITDFETIQGKGLCGKDEQNNALFVGSVQYILSQNDMPFLYEKQMEKVLKEGKTPILVMKNHTVLGVIAIADTIKEDALESIQTLKKMGIKTVMLTGDHKLSAQFIADQVGVEEVIAQVLPNQKADRVKMLQDKGEVVMMVGDGINDAPALTQADVGCAIGNGSDIAIDSADIVLMKSKLQDVSRAVHLSKITIRCIRQNLFWAFCYNVIGIPIAAGLLYPAFGLLLSPMIGSLAMSLSSLFVVGNALSLKRKKV